MRKQIEMFDDISKTVADKSEVVFMELKKLREDSAKAICVEEEKNFKLQQRLQILEQKLSFQQSEIQEASDSLLSVLIFYYEAPFSRRSHDFINFPLGEEASRKSRSGKI